MRSNASFVRTLVNVARMAASDTAFPGQRPANSAHIAVFQTLFLILSSRNPLRDFLQNP